MTGVVFSIERYALEDGPGIRTLVFLKGCPLTCEWCSNPESQVHQPQILYFANKCAACGRCIALCPQAAIRQDEVYGLVTDTSRCMLCGLCTEACYYNAREISGREMTVREVMDVLLRDKVFYDESGGGVTFSGGEPLLQAQFVQALAEACHTEGIHTAIETTLYANETLVAETLEKIDLVFVDFKHCEATQHLLHTGVPNERIVQNIQLIDDLGKNFIIRIPFIPGINDDLEVQKKIYSWAASLKNLQCIEVLPYHRLGLGKYKALGRIYPMGETAPLKKQDLLYLEEIGKECGVCVRIGAQ